MIAFPVWALVALRDRAGDGSFVLTAIGLALVIAGLLLVSNRLAEPNYDTILSWDPAALPTGWERTRARYFALNWIRALITWAAFALSARPDRRGPPLARRGICGVSSLSAG